MRVADDCLAVEAESEGLTRISIHLSDLEPISTPHPTPLPAQDTTIVVPPPDAAAPEDPLDDTDSADFPYNVYGTLDYWGSGRLGPGGWIIGAGDRMGIFSIPFRSDDISPWNEIMIQPEAMIHFISGPRQTDLPPRIYETTLTLSKQMYLSHQFACIASVRMGWFTDFEGSVREGLRFPSHAMALYRHDAHLDWIAGIDYLDRDDVRILPIFGFLWKPNDDWRIEAIFPRPRFVHRFAGRWFRFGAEMGGNTFDMVRASGVEDVATYRDFRFLFAIQSDASTDADILEIGYVFSRHLEYRSGTPDFKPTDSVILRTVRRY